MGRGFSGLATALGALAGAAIVAASSGLSGCSSGSSSSGDDAGGPDGPFETDAPIVAPPGPDAAGDAAGDAGLADAADAADAAKPPLDGGAPFCTSLAPKPRFCDDFDDGVLTDDWTQSAFVPGAVVELDGTSFTSGPASFHIKTPATGAATANNALLRTTTFAPVSHLRLAFAAFLPAVSFTKGSIALATLDVSLDHFFTLYLRDMAPITPAAILEEYVAGTVTRHLLTSLPPVNAWTRIKVDIDLMLGRANVSFGAQKALDAAPITALAGSEATVRLGAIIDGPAEAFEARFDDVTVDY